MISGEKKIKWYVDHALLSDGRLHATVLIPFLGNTDRDENDPDFSRYNDYEKQGKEFFVITDQPESADYFLLPFSYTNSNADQLIAKELAARAKSVGKMMVLFYNADDDQPLGIENAIVFRTSFNKSQSSPFEYALPGWSADFGCDLNASEKPSKPIISYCGYIDYNSGWEKLRLLMNKSVNEKNPGPKLRGEAVRTLKRDQRIETRFIIRSGFWAPEQDKKSARAEYIANMKSADYALVIRGAGNFSYRLYEVLSAGKIPVFVNTDSALPFDRIIDWKKEMVWIEESELPAIAEKLVQFHERLTDEEFNQLKKNCRLLYENRVSPLGFYSQLHQILFA